MSTRKTQGSSPVIAIIGAGFGGLGMGYYLKQAGIESFTLYEKAADVGGVWRENTYPGAACDIPSHLYSYSFEPHYPWSCRYGKQAEILEYQRHVARRHDLRRHVRFGRELAGADFDEARGVWVLRFTDGEVQEAQVLVTAVGQLHRPQIPKIKGLAGYQGRVFHSARWDHDYDLNGKTVAVIGTGASAVQFVPVIAPQVKQLHVFQRSPGWVIPKFDRRFTAWERKLLDRVPLIHDLDRQRIFWSYDYLATAFTLGSDALLARPPEAYLRYSFRLLLRRQVKDPELRKKLTPEFPLGCKRTLLSNEWLATLARPNVEVVTEPVAEVTASGVKTGDGQLRKVDAIIHGTGFAATEFLAPMEFKGLQGRSLRQQWKDGAEAFLGIGVSGFPNLFLMYGPNTNLGGGSIIYMLEQQARYILQGVQLLRERGLRYLDVRPEAQRAYNDELQERNKHTAFETGCQSWYIVNGRNTNNWVGYMHEYGQRVRRLEPEHYQLAPAAG